MGSLRAVGKMKEVMDKELAKYKEYESENGYVGFYESHPCPECGNSVDGVGVFATGKLIKYTNPVWEYQPYEDELLKNIWMECEGCGWDQYS